MKEWNPRVDRCTHCNEWHSDKDKTDIGDCAKFGWRIKKGVAMRQAVCKTW